MRKRAICCIMALLCGVLPLRLAAAASPNAASSASSGSVPTTIHAERMEYDAEKQTVVFTTKVYVKRPDFELWAEKMTVYLKKDSNKTRPVEDATASGMAAGDIERLVAEKNVRFKRDDKEGSCQKATYLADAGKVILEGSPVLKDSDKQVEGKRITHYLKDNRTDVDGGGQPVIATFQTPDNSGREGGMPSFGPKGKKDNGTAAKP